MQPRSLADRPRVHTLSLGASERHRRQGVARWLGDELGHGAKVLYKGWLDHDATPDRHWLFGPAGPRGARDALGDGRLEFMDVPTLIDRTGGTADGLLDLHHREVRDALRGGWTRVAMSSDTPRRPMGPGEAEELAAHEKGLSEIVASWPVTVLCQLAVGEESEASAFHTVAAHHQDLVDDAWAAAEVDGAWFVRGELDAWVAGRFAAALRAALHDDAPRDGRPDLHVDLGEVEFMDVACARMLDLAVRSADRPRRIVLHRPSLVVRRLLSAMNLPRAVVLDGGAV